MIYCQPSFTRRYDRLTPKNRSRVDAAVARLEDAFGRPHLHTGVGIRPFGRYLELRAGLDLRVLFLPEGGDLFLMCVGNHDEIRSYVKGNP
jgi:hypothetical protein